MSIETIDTEKLQRISNISTMGQSGKGVYETNTSKRYIGRLNINYSRNWQTFVNCGLPVVDHLYVSPDDLHVYMPDLTENGSLLLGKVVEEKQIRNISIKHEHRLIYKSIIGGYLPKIFNHCLDLSKIATDQNVLLPWDDPFEVIIDPFLNWNIICLDLETGGKKSEIKSIELNFTERKMLKAPVSAVNTSSVLSFIERLKRIKNKI